MEFMKTNYSFKIVTSYPLNHEPVIKNRLVPYIEVLSKQGYDVTLISPDVKPFSLHNVTFKHIRSPDKKKKPKSLTSRLIFETIQSFRLLMLAKRYKTEYTLVTVPSMFLLFLGFLLPKKGLHFDVRDLTWEYLSSDSFVNRIIKTVFRKFAKMNLSRARSVNVTNSAEYSYLIECFGFSKPIKLVSNGVSKGQFSQLSTIESVSTGRLSVGYIGNVGLAQKLDTLVDLASSLSNIDVYIVGEGTDYPRIKAIVESLNLPNLFLTGRLQWQEVLCIYERLDVLYAQLSPEFASAVPSKLYEYLSTGKFVIYGGGEQAKNLLEEFNNNVVIPPCNADHLIREINHLLNNDARLKVSQANKVLIEKNYIRERGVEEFVKEIGSL